MNKITICAAFVLGAVAAFAEPSWALLNTDPSDAGDTTGSYASRYTAYLCTKEAAAALFGGNSSVEGITAYLGENAVDYAEGGMTALDYYGFDEGQYSFSTYFAPGSLVGDYIAVVASAGGAGEDDMVRVFETRMNGDTLLFDPELPNGGTAGSWAAAVPEPTSGVLFLLGLASLALRRKKGEG